MKTQNKGFTLIELLVVIAIIGILASVVIAALNSARTKGSDAAIKANLANIRAQAALYYDPGATYNATGVEISCNVLGVSPYTVDAGCGELYSTTLGALEGLKAAAAASGTTAYGYISADGSEFAAAVALKTSGAGYFCVDSNGAGKVVTTMTLATPFTLCP